MHEERRLEGEGRWREEGRERECSISFLLTTDQADYIANSEVVTFTPTQNSFILTVGIVDDDVVENPEVFLAMAELVSAADAGDVIIAPESTTVTILDEDSKLIAIDSHHGGHMT